MNDHFKARYMAESYPELAARVAEAIATSQEDFEIYHNMILKQMFIPSGNTLLAGKVPIRPNCSILPTLTDENVEEMKVRAKQLWSDRIGIGFDLSGLSDPVKVLKELSEINANIDLGHRPQRGNLATLNSTHKDIKEFITCKLVGAQSGNTNILYNFNLSIGIEDTNHTKTNSEILELAAECAHKCGDPAIINLDLVQGIPAMFSESTPEAFKTKVILSQLGRVKTSVPCAELSMTDEESCTLGCVNINSSEFILHGTISPDLHIMEQIDVNLLIHTIKTAVRFLDDVIDKLNINDIAMKKRSLETRRIGLGLFGWADLLKKFNIRYGSEESLKLAHQIGKLFQKAAHEASEELAITRGQAPILVNTNIRRRHIAITCIPPTGGICLLTPNKGFAIEPLFEDLANITIDDHLNMMSVFQLYIDNCISKTINLPENAQVSDIIGIWQKSKSLGLKSVSVYRDNSKTNQPLKIGSKIGNKEEVKEESNIKTPEVITNTNTMTCRSGMCEA